MNASLARRIRCAELLLIYAIDRHNAEQRERTQSAQPPIHAIRFPVVDRNRDRTGGDHKQDTRSESCVA